MGKELISIIVPVYNVEPYIRKCLDSIIDQTYTDFEVLLIDDGSSDGSGAICDEYSLSDSRFHVFHQENSGVSAARNVGLSQCKGVYVTFVDADDFLHPQMLEILYTNLKSGDYDFSMCVFKKVWPDYLIDEVIDTNWVKTELGRDTLIYRLFKSYEHTMFYNVCSTKLYKRILIGDAQFKYYSEAEDAEFNCRIYSKVTKTVYLDVPLYYYVQRASSSTHQKVSLKKIDATNAFYECYKDLQGYDVFQSYSLVRLYKRILSINYLSRGTKYEKAVHEMHAEIVHNTEKDLISNKYISIPKKIALLLSYYFPLPYYFLRDFLEWKARIGS